MLRLLVSSCVAPPADTMCACAIARMPFSAAMISYTMFLTLSLFSLVIFVAGSTWKLLRSDITIGHVIIDDS